MYYDNVKNTFFFSPALNTNTCFDYSEDIWAVFFSALSLFSVYETGDCHNSPLSFLVLCSHLSEGENRQFYGHPSYGDYGSFASFPQHRTILSHTHGVAAIKIILTNPFARQRFSWEKAMCHFHTICNSGVSHWEHCTKWPSVKFLTVMYRYGYES